MRWQNYGLDPFLLIFWRLRQQVLQFYVCPPRVHRTSRSLLWNLWRRDATKDAVRTSSFFGVVRTRRTADGTRWRYFWRPFDDEPKPSAIPTALAAPAIGAPRGDLFAPRPARPAAVGQVAAR